MVASNDASWRPAPSATDGVPSTSASASGVLYEDSWEVSALETARLFTVQLLCAGGSGAIAKTAVAPLERVKVGRDAWGGTHVVEWPAGGMCEAAEELGQGKHMVKGFR